MTGRIAFQGEPGAYSHQACRDARPEMEPLPCRTFEEVITAVTSGAAELAMLPVENTTYGRVADIHRLLPESGLYIVDEAFVRVHISLMALPGVAIEPRPIWNSCCAVPKSATIGKKSVSLAFCFRSGVWEKKSYSVGCA